MLKVTEYTLRIDKLKEKVREAFDKANIDIRIKDNKSNTIRLVFVMNNLYLRQILMRNP